MMYRFDVAIAGGGAIGLCIAYELTSRGFTVAILDGTDARMASSYGNAGYISPSLGPLSMNAREVEDVARYLASLTGGLPRLHTGMGVINDPKVRMLIRTMALESRDWYARMSSILGFAYRHSGMLEVYLTREGLEQRLEHVKHLASTLNIPYRVLEGDDVSALEPTIRECSGALLYPDDAHIEPRTLIKALKDTLRRLGVTFLGSLEHVGFDGHGKGGVEFFQSDDAVVKADTYIVCTGAYRVKGLNLPVAGARGYMLELANSPMPSHPLLCSEHRVAVSFHDNRLRLSGIFEVCSVGSTPVEENFAKLLKWSEKYLRLNDAIVVDRWAGYRPCTPDGLPIVGRVNSNNGGDNGNLIVATGHCRLGITLAPSTARLVASLVEGRDDVPDALKPNRYEPHGMMV